MTVAQRVGKRASSTMLAAAGVLALGTMLCGLASRQVRAEEAPAPAEAETPAEKSPDEQLDINAETVEMDFAARKAIFEGNVTVSDSKMQLLANRMEVHLTEKNELKLIEATGEVVIRELGTEKKATAGKAIYDVLKDEIVLSENPVLSEQQGEISGAEKIVYTRKDQKFRFTGGTTGVSIKYNYPKDKAGGTGTGFFSPATGGGDRK